MYKCVKITFVVDCSVDILTEFVQRHAIKMGLEGVMKMIDATSASVVVCGEKDKIDDFIDVLHKGSKDCSLQDIQIEAFLKDKDYRRTFRIIR